MAFKRRISFWREIPFPTFTWYWIDIILFLFVILLNSSSWNIATCSFFSSHLQSLLITSRAQNYETVCSILFGQIFIDRSATQLYFGRSTPQNSQTSTITSSFLQSFKTFPTQNNAPQSWGGVNKNAVYESSNFLTKLVSSTISSLLASSRQSSLHGFISPIFSSWLHLTNFLFMASSHQFSLHGFIRPIFSLWLHLTNFLFMASSGQFSLYGFISPIFSSWLH